MDLTIKNVHCVAQACLYADDKRAVAEREGVRAEGILRTLVFDPEKVVSRKADIEALLRQLPKQFFQAGGGGWSFLNMCEDRRGKLWGQHPDMEILCCLGIAAGLGKWMLPREYWSAMPGGMPYYVVLLDAD